MMEINQKLNVFQKEKQLFSQFSNVENAKAYIQFYYFTIGDGHEDVARLWTLILQKVKINKNLSSELRLMSIISSSGKT